MRSFLPRWSSRQGCPWVRRIIPGMRLPSIALLVVALAATASPGAHGTETREYLAATGDASVLLCSERPSLGGACFGIPSAHPTARIRIDDDLGLPVGGAYRFEGADGAALSRGSFCRFVDAPIPAAAENLTVFVSSIRSPLDCPVVNGEIPGVGTRGVVTVTWLTSAAAGGSDVVPLAPGSGAGAVAGSATVSGGCLTVAGGISHGTGRQRWVAAYWPVHPSDTGGLCEEATAHTDLTFQCVETVGPEFFAQARGADSKTYLIRIWDGGIDESDHVGVRIGSPDGDSCGAAQVPVAPVSEGVFVVVDAL